MRGRGRVWVQGAALLGLVLAGCSGDSGPSEIEKAAAQIAAAATSTTAPPATTATTAAAPSTSAPPATTAASATTPGDAPAGLGPGDRGGQVADLEKRLDALKYDVAKIDDVYDQNTAYAVMAFQKVHGMARTGRTTDDVIAALGTARTPDPLVPNGGENRVEIDIPRQVLFLYKANTLQKILPISSGNNKRFCSEGWCRRAVTPGGSYGFYRQGRGWETGPLGSLYNPVYFNGGIAVHGSRSVPAQPASHGCVRIPMSAAEWFPSAVHMGMPVHVYGVEGQPPNPEARTSTTATTAPPSTSPPSTATPTTAPGITPPTVTTVPDLLGGLLNPT
ncbi:MAG TPA: L,D-transpeptidase family protein [Acidimicrobiales bacterium]|nr:L,D-transpeptidase family protein [Acidimicrobiales bacterium]